MNKNDTIFVAGHNGMVGSAIMRALLSEGYNRIVTVSRQELDLRDTRNVELFFAQEHPAYVFLAAARVGGIQANREFPGDFLYDNIMIQSNIIHQCLKVGVKKLVFLGSSCIYPRECPQPMKEEYLMTGPLEPTNEGYALAKIAGLRLTQYYHKQYRLQCLNPIPCNLYGTNDSFDPMNSHVLAALVKKFVDAIDENQKKVVLWGSGIARREFMHVDDLASALLFLTKNWNSPEIINVGWGTDISIKELAEIISEKVNYYGKIYWDNGMPDGMLRKCLDTSKLDSLGFKPSITLDDGIDRVIKEYRDQKYNKGLS
ncbi:MAG: GDP-L-fucose synthase [Nitrospirota bacterium]